MQTNPAASGTDHEGEHEKPWGSSYAAIADNVPLLRASIVLPGYQLAHFSVVWDHHLIITDVGIHLI